MLPVFRKGLGGRIGPGRQFVPWISLDDAIAAIHHAIATPGLRGPVNAVAPHLVTNREFTRTLGRVLRRPTLLPLPAFAARAAFGRMADELLLASARIRPARLDETGFPFRDPELSTALRWMLGRPATKEIHG
jgi:NAD dependent epimerase/dehydratase family enzyme